MINIGSLRSTFIDKYGREPRVFRAPGRVNLIGEHTDYNDGFVMPCAIGFATYVAGALRNDRRIRARSLNFDHGLEFDLDEPLKGPDETWAKYVQGVGLILEREGHRLSGADLLIDSDVPVGAGLSSSAALEIATAFALVSLSGQQIDRTSLAKIGQTAEHEFAGVRSGIMDQFASVFGQKNHALFLDCRSMEWQSVPLGSARFLICNTNTKHDLAESEYNKRRAECEQAAEYFGKRSLRDVTLEEVNNRSGEMPEILKKRARHVIGENMRVLDAVDALGDGDMNKFGRLLNESHESLRSDFQVSSRELDLMAELARGRNFVLGARMTGGGFGGCTVNLMTPGHHNEFIENISELYFRETGIVPDIYEAEIAHGVCEVQA